MTWRTCARMSSRTALKRSMRFLQFCGVQIQFSGSGHRYGFPFSESSICKSNLLRGAEARGGFERRQDVLLGLVPLACCEIGPGQIVLRGGLVERVQGHHSCVLPERAGVIFLVEPQVPRWRCSSSSFTG